MNQVININNSSRSRFFGLKDKIKKLLYLTSLLSGLVIGLLLFAFFTPNYYSEKGTKRIFVERGATFNNIIDTLYYNNVISNRYNIKIVSYITGGTNKIRAGSYDIPNGLTYNEIMDILISNFSLGEKLVTIQEGIWQPNLARIFKNELGLDSSKIMGLSQDITFIHRLGLDVENLEGYLLPETYYFYLDRNEEQVLRKLKEEMDKIFDDSARVQMERIGMTKNQILILASIIEGESNKMEEFKTISGVYHNRLEKGMLLQADPTVQFLIRNRDDKRVKSSDLTLDSPYNTYKYVGLPPSPINNPGKAAIEAALYPEQHDYLYFVADGTGGHKFAKTYSEHQIYVREYRRWLRSQ
ncbi:MAG: endolytic transglycosylase MltG [Ignavibacteriales bacterium]|nr:endolytic transglycosylase MltG [Ignavibacteriales bacterium]